MLTAKQKSLFALLEVSESREPELRKHHKSVLTYGAPRDFTAWLADCLQAKWRSNPSIVYLGD